MNNINELVPLPNGFDFFEESNGDLIFTVETSAENDLGEYVIQVTGSIDEGPQAGTQSNFRFSVLVQPDGLLPENSAPIFLSDLQPLIQATAGEDEFTFDLEIPEIFDAEGDAVFIDFDYSSLTGFLRYDSSLDKIVPNRVNGVNFDFVPVGNFFLTITLTDDNPVGPLSTSYSVFVQVAPKPDDGGGDPDPPGPDPPGPEPITPADPTQPADEGIISDLTNTGDVVINLDNNFNLNSLL